MESMVRTVISVLKCLPQFVILSRELQIALLKRSIHGLFAFCGALAYDVEHQGFRVVFEEDDGELNIFYLDFRNYVSRGLNQIRQTTWGRSEMGEAVLAPYIDKVRPGEGWGESWGELARAGEGWRGVASERCGVREDCVFSDCKALLHLL